MNNSIRITLIFFCYMIIFNNTAPAQLNDDQITAFRNAKTARLVFNINIKGDISDLNLPFKEITTRLFEYANVNIIQSESKKSELTVTIEATLAATSAKYYLSDLRSVPIKSIGRLYTGGSAPWILVQNGC